MLLLLHRSSWFNLLPHTVKDKLMPPPIFQCPITVIKLSIWLPLKSVHHLHLFSSQHGQSGEAFWSRGSWVLLYVWISFIDYGLLWIDHSA